MYMFPINTFSHNRNLGIRGSLVFQFKALWPKLSGSCPKNCISIVNTVTCWSIFISFSTLLNPLQSKTLTEYDYQQFFIAWAMSSQSLNPMTFEFLSGCKPVIPESFPTRHKLALAKRPLFLFLHNIKGKRGFPERSDENDDYTKENKFLLSVLKWRLLELHETTGYDLWSIALNPGLPYSLHHLEPLKVDPQSPPHQFLGQIINHQQVFPEGDKNTVHGKMFHLRIHGLWSQELHAGRNLLRHLPARSRVNWNHHKHSNAQVPVHFHQTDHFCWCARHTMIHRQWRVFLFHISYYFSGYSSSHALAQTEEHQSEFS